MGAPSDVVLNCHHIVNVGDNPDVTPTTTSS